MMRQAPTVSICVPAYNSAAFVARALESAQCQSFEDIEILVSVDVSDDSTEDICRSFERDARVRVLSSTRRLGWAQNYNRLLSEVRGHYFTFLAHDDLLEERYIADLVMATRAHPNAAAVYAGMQQFGATDDPIDYPSLEGTAYQRMMTVLYRDIIGITLQALKPSRLIGQGLRLHTNTHDSFLSDALFVLDCASRGDCVYLPEAARYRRWVRDGSVTHAWMNWSCERKLQAWIEHSRQCLELVSGVPLAKWERLALASAVAARLIYMVRRHCRGPEVTALDDAAVAAFLAAHAAGMSDIDTGALEFQQLDVQHRKFGARQAQDRGQDWLVKRSWLAAESEFRRAIDLDPMLAESHRLRGAALAQLDRKSEALQAMLDATVLAPQDPQALVDCARLLAGMHARSEALSFAERAHSLVPTDPEYAELVRTLRPQGAA